MDKRLLEVNNFSVKCDELINGKFILADKKITAVLKSIAGSETLYKLIQNCLEGFDYEAQKELSFLPSGKGNEYESDLRLPEDSGGFVAFVFCLLLDFDNKEIDLHKFLQTFFYEDGSFFESFAAFCANLIAPFKTAVKDIAIAVIAGERELSEERAVTAPEMLSQNAVEKALRLLFEDKEGLNSVKRLSDEERQELSELIDGLASAVRTKEKALIRTLFLGYKNSLKNIKRLRCNWEKLQAVLTEYSLM